MVAYPYAGRILGTAALLLVTVHGVSAQEGAENPDQAKYDKIVSDFIRFDIGQIRDPVAIEQIKARFNRLRTDDAVPSLVRGLNVSTRMRASCPITAISSKLRGIVNASKNPEVGTYVLQHLERNDVGNYQHNINSIFDAAEKQVARTMMHGLAARQFKRRAVEDLQRMGHTPGMRLSELALREDESGGGSNGSAANDKKTGRGTASGGDGESAIEEVDSQASDASPNGQSLRARTGKSSAARSIAPPAVDLTKLTLDELVERLEDRTAQLKALGELSRRANLGSDREVSRAADGIVKCLTDGDTSVRESAARLLGLIRYRQGVPRLIDALDDPDAKVRSASATALARTTRQLFGPNDDATPDERQVAIARWREWWGRQTNLDAGGAER